MEPVDLKQILGNVEQGWLIQALEATGHNKNRAAKLLGIQRTTLVAKLKKYGMSLQTPYRTNPPPPDHDQGHV